MKMRKIYVTCSIILFVLFGINTSFAAINLAISPLKYELEAEVGDTITRTAKVTNRTDNNVHIYTGKSDFVPNGINGIPQFIRKTELVNPDQILSTWITIDTPEFDLLAGETREISFQINIPENATPGGHYGAVFFKNNSSEVSSENSVGINVDYGVIILVNIDGEIVVDIDIEEPVIYSGGGGTPNNKRKKDDCSYGDLTSSNYDGKCVDSLDEIIKDLQGIQEEENDTSTGAKNNEEDFNINFNIPIQNDGNTHVKPVGKIILIDEEGKEIKRIGKEIIVNDRGVVIGEKIVDYIPINDDKGNILPKSKRIYQCDWKGFPYKSYDDEGNEIMKYWDPSEYYTKENIKDGRVLMIWERVCERVKTKKIKAIFDVNYDGVDGENINFNSAEEFEVTYIEEYIGINWYVVILLSFFVFIFIIWIFIIVPKRRRKREEELKTRLIKELEKKVVKKVTKKKTTYSKKGSKK